MPECEKCGGAGLTQKILGYVLGDGSTEIRSNGEVVEHTTEELTTIWPCSCPAGIKEQYPGAVVFTSKQKATLGCMVDVALIRAQEYKDLDITSMTEMQELIERIEQDFQGTLIWIPKEEE